MNDKAFAIYATCLVAAVTSLFTFVVAIGIASIPPLAVIVEHVALGLAIRTSYKSFDGSNPFVDFLEFYGWKTATETEAPAYAIAQPA